MKSGKSGLKVAKTVLQIITRRLNGFPCCPVIGSCKNRWRHDRGVATSALCCNAEQTQHSSGAKWSLVVTYPPPWLRLSWSSVGRWSAAQHPYQRPGMKYVQLYRQLEDSIILKQLHVDASFISKPYFCLAAMQKYHFTFLHSCKIRSWYRPGKEAILMSHQTNNSCSGCCDLLCVLKLVFNNTIPTHS